MCGCQCQQLSSFSLILYCFAQNEMRVCICMYSLYIDSSLIKASFNCVGRGSLKSLSREG